MKVINFKYVGLLLCGWLVSFSGVAQDEIPMEGAEGEVQNTQIVIEKNREIELPRETKVYEFIKWQPKKEEFVLPKTRFVNYEYDQALMPISFSPISLPSSAKDATYRQYAKVGFGNYGSPLVDLSMSTPGDANMVAGLNFKHLSYAKGAVDGANSASGTYDAGIYFLKIWDRVKVKTTADYRFDKNYFYGYPDGTVVDRESIKRANNFIKAGLEVDDNNDKDRWSYTGALAFKNFSDNYENKESTFEVNGTVGFDEKVFLDADLVLSQYDNGAKVSRSVYRVVPYYGLSIANVTADIGVSVNGQTDDVAVLSPLRIFPYINARYKLNDSFDLFANLDGGFDANTMYSLAGQMPYLNPSFGVANTQINLDVNGGIRGNLSDQIAIEARAGFKALKNLPVFINSSTDQSLIDAVYDSATVNIFNVGLTTNFQINATNSVTFDLNYFGFKPGALDEVYHRPTTEIKVIGDHQLLQKLTVQWQFALLSDIKAFDPNSNQTVGLDVIPKFDVMAHYQIKDRWGAFMSFENILNKNYSRYLFYPQRGIMFKAGVTYRF